MKRTELATCINVIQDHVFKVQTAREQLQRVIDEQILHFNHPENAGLADVMRVRSLIADYSDGVMEERAFRYDLDLVKKNLDNL